MAACLETGTSMEHYRALESLQLGPIYGSIGVMAELITAGDQAPDDVVPRAPARLRWVCTVDVPAKNLMILLPGAYMTTEQILAAGFHQAAREDGHRYDLLLVELDMSFQNSQALFAEVHKSIRTAVEQRAYQSIWLGGISLGGMLAMAYASLHPSDLQGLCLIAPYPGSRLTAASIAGAGGLDRWQPSPDELADPELRAWYWLKSSPRDLPIYFGFGDQDRFAQRMMDMAGRCKGFTPEIVRGGHDFATWGTLWRSFLRGTWRELGNPDAKRP